MEKTYKPDAIEQHWAQFWEHQHYFEPSGQGQPYCIALPPPNVTGTLHMGHGFQHTLMDALVRQHRMRGYNTLWQPGTDHAGIATQMVIERQLEAQNLTRHDLGREKFIERVWHWREQSGSTINRQIRRVGNSLAWSREQFSLDPQICNATTEAFIRLFEEGLIYRGKRLVNWDPKFNSAISDLEVTNTIEQGHLWHIRYPLSDGKGELIVATTRPETLFGDTAVAVHPEDERYQALIGKTVRLPLCDRDIPIIADEEVDREFGSGCVKVTPAHDFNDYAMGQRHQLPMINIFTSNAFTNENVPSAYQNLDRYQARKQVIADLKAAKFLIKTEAHQHSIPRGDRSGEIIEPMLTDQWFVKTEPLAAAAIEAVNTGKLKFVPENWSKTYLQWLNNIQDWCISRQLWWGHRIPVWYDANNNHYVGYSEADVRQRYQLAEHIDLAQDEDVLDTWFTAALWPFSSLGWPNKTTELQNFYPNNVLVTGFDIIFFWVARMVMMGLKLLGDVPFREVYVTGLIRDHEGQKMSKTKGNILDPIDLIDGITLDELLKKRLHGLMQPQMAQKIETNTRKLFPDGIPSFGTDALRFTFCALASTGRDINFDLNRTTGYRNFCNKLWNAARYVFMNTENQCLDQSGELSIADRWIQSELQHTIEKVNPAFTQYRFDLIAQALYEFIWNEYCDWYLEFSKCILNNPNASTNQLAATRYTLVSVLETILRLAHPIIPYITEEIWQTAAGLLKIEGDSVMLQPYPESKSTDIDAEAQQVTQWLKAMITGIRNIRSELGVAPGKQITAILTKGKPNDKQLVEHYSNYITTLAKVSSISWADSTPADSTSFSVGELDVHLPLAGIIDKDAELKRLTKEISKITQDKQRAENKLNNKNYLAKAPASVVEQEKQRLQLANSTLEKLEQQLNRIKALQSH